MLMSVAFSKSVIFIGSGNVSDSLKTMESFARGVILLKRAVKSYKITVFVPLFKPSPS